MKKLLLLGASGSIGQQTIDLLLNKKIDYELVGVSVGKNIEYLEKILPLFHTIKYVYVIDEKIAKSLQNLNKNIKFYSEKDGFEPLILNSKPDVVVNALVGFVGVIPSLITIKNNIDLALANKESMVVAGDLIKESLKTSSSQILPIDSEHVAIDKCLQHIDRNELKTIILTCSGGPFREKTEEDLKYVTKNDALKHPTWKMGNKITIDSATLINKVFEIIEAHYLFDVDVSNIEVLIHPESKVHSMIETKNDQTLLEYGPSDMRLPIYYALSYRANTYLGHDEFIKNAAKLHFFEPNEFQNKVLSIAKTVLLGKGNLGCILNSANDFLVEKFLNEEISFLDIYKYINLALQNVEYIKNPNLEDIISTNNIVKYYLLNAMKEGK